MTRLVNPLNSGFSQCNVFQEDGELVSGFQDEVSLPRNREGLVWIQRNKSFNIYSKASIFVGCLSRHFEEGRTEHCLQFSDQILFDQIQIERSPERLHKNWRCKI